MGKIAADLELALRRRAVKGERGSAKGRSLARGESWSVDDVICTNGPADRAFEERHTRVSLAVVVAGTFQYRSPTGRALMTPGSILLGNHAQCFECGHDHAAGDRCVAFNYAPEYFERIAADAGAPDTAKEFSAPSLPALRDSAEVAARASVALVVHADESWEEIAVQVAAQVARLASERRSAQPPIPRTAQRRVTDVVRSIEHSPSHTQTLSELARVAGLSPYHFSPYVRTGHGTDPTSIRTAHASA